MPLNPNQETSFQESLRISRILWTILTFVSPTAYFFVYAVRLLQGNTSFFLIGFNSVPWSNPVVIAMLTVSVLDVLAIVFIPNMAMKSPKNRNLPFHQKLRIRLVISLALLNAIAIYGLILGNTIGKSVATLSLVMFFFPILGGFLYFPSEQSWLSYSEKNGLLPPSPDA